MVKYRQTLVARSVAALDTAVGEAALEAAFAAASGDLAASTRARHLAALRSRASLVA